MKRERVDALLQRARMRSIPSEQLVGYTAAVRRRLSAQPATTVVPARPIIGWWRVGVPIGAIAALLMAVVLVRPIHRSPQLTEETSLVEEVAILTTVAPEESLLPEEDGVLLDEMEWLDQNVPREIQI